MYHAHPNTTHTHTQRTVVDGAFAHNNPSASMVAFLLQQQYTRDDLAVLSIGNGDAVGVADDPVSVFKVRVVVRGGVCAWWCVFDGVCLVVCVTYILMCIDGVLPFPSLSPPLLFPIPTFPPLSFLYPPTIPFQFLSPSPFISPSPLIATTAIDVRHRGTV